MKELKNMAETDIFQLEEKYKDMTDENLINEAIKNQNNVALDCLMGRYKDIVNSDRSPTRYFLLMVNTLVFFLRFFLKCKQQKFTNY